MTKSNRTLTAGSLQVMSISESTNQKSVPKFE